VDANQHIDDELLERYAMGRLTERDAVPVEEHLLICECCRARLEETDAYVRAMREACRRCESGAE